MLCVCKNCVANSTFDSLKPAVFELATLLPTTSIVVSAACRPVRAVVMADCRPMVVSPPRESVPVVRAAGRRNTYCVGDRQKVLVIGNVGRAFDARACARG